MMTIPPFPSQDLAKLVLGYLAEEQLMTAYDEFLQTTPYLDVVKNEYDRLFMTSLKSILAEYRAVKIYVESCKPIKLRRKLFQCTNLLEVVKFLINHLDLSKINNSPQSNFDRSSFKTVDLSDESTPKTACEGCNSPNMNSCTCKIAQTNIEYNTSRIEITQLTNLVDATPLSDMPGKLIKRKYVKIMGKDTGTSFSSCHSDIVLDTNYKRGSIVSNKSYPDNNLTSTATRQSCMSSEEIDQNIGNVYHEVLDVVCNKDAVSCDINNELQNTSHKAAVGGDDINLNIVPDSSTAENMNVILHPPPNAGQNLTPPGQNPLNNKLPKLFLSTGESTSKGTPKSYNKPLESKSIEPKITILSNENITNKSSGKIPKILQKASLKLNSNQMQTILINGTPAYKQPKNHSFSKDEIMAMPTIFLVPVSGPSEIPVKSQNHGGHVSNVSSNIGSVASLEPLTIDITNSPSTNENDGKFENLFSLSNKQKFPAESSLIKIVDETVTEPKENEGKTSSTPQTFPPLRKSSSTPRRSSHVRVLDFTTPRRILQKATNEDAKNDNYSTIKLQSVSSDIQHSDQDSSVIAISNILADSTKLNKCKEKVISKSGNWDADLRAILSVNETNNHSVPIKRKSKNKSSRKKKSDDSLQPETKEDKKHSNKKKASPKSNKRKKRKSDDMIITPSEVKKTVEIAIKPTINIIPGNDWVNTSNKETEKSRVQNQEQIDTQVRVQKQEQFSTQVKVQNQEQINSKVKAQSQEPIDTVVKIQNQELVDTPEAERQVLQNAIGLKLNISDILETPYKQALYDIQMETPRFLEPDIATPNTPFSDIKIMNIPTPRFLEIDPNSCQPTQATPSSYSSRPTDYSSGGSYYKPDDLDYFPDPEKFDCPPILPKMVETPAKENKSRVSKSSRPVRQCTKNVSYCKYSPFVKNKSDNNENQTSTINVKSKTRKNQEHLLNDSNEKEHTKIENKKQIRLSKKHKSNMKNKSPKSYIKIKPKVTPNKRNIYGQTKGKSSDSFHKASPKSQVRKRTSSKDKLASTSLVVVPVSTKSRRKSSTPRKLHCAEDFNSESVLESGVKSSSSGAQDSDAEQLPLRWSDDASEEPKLKDKKTNISTNEEDDISKIQDYIEKEFKQPASTNSEAESSKNNEGFDSVSAKIIERDLLDSPLYTTESKSVKGIDDMAVTSTSKSQNEKINDTSSTISVNLVINEEEEDDFEFSYYDCNKDEGNYIFCSHNDEIRSLRQEPITLRDKFCMEVCIDDGLTIRLRAIPFNSLFDHEYDDLNAENQKEVESAVNSISNIDRLYTPMKDPYKDECFQIFDSTLTSLDTPLKPNSPQRKTKVETVSEIVLEVEPILEENSDAKDKSENTSKRKRMQSASVSDESIKRVRTETQYLLNSANIQNMDIESVLSKLHGP